MAICPPKNYTRPSVTIGRKIQKVDVIWPAKEYDTVKNQSSASSSLITVEYCPQPPLPPEGAKVNSFPTKGLAERGHLIHSHAGNFAKRNLDDG